jgi:hypothetical protein
MFCRNVKNSLLFLTVVFISVKITSTGFTQKKIYFKKNLVILSTGFQAEIKKMENMNIKKYILRKI